MDTGTAFTGTDKADTFNATVLTANDGDVIDGGDGVDTLNLETVTSITSSFAAKNVEKVNLTALAGISVDAKNIADMTTLTSSNAAGAVTVSNIAKANLEATIAGTVTNSLTLNYGTGVLGGTADTLKVTLAGASAASLSASAGFESVELATTAKSDLASLTASGATKLTLSGAAELTVADSVIDAIKTVTITNTGKTKLGTHAAVKVLDGAANTAGIIQATTTSSGLDNGTSSKALKSDTSGASITLGAGDDVINVDGSAVFSTGNTIVSAGAGNDNLHLSGVSASSEFIYGQAGDDYIYVSAATGANDMVDGGEGTDTLAFLGNDLTYSLIAKGIENIKVGGATTKDTTVNFVTTDTAAAISDAADGAVSFSNLTAGSSYTSSVKKLEALTLGFKAASAATLGANFTKGTDSTVTLTNVADATLTLGAASALGVVTVDSATTKLTINATGAMSGNAAVAAAVDGTGEKLATLTITGDKAIDMDAITNDRSLKEVSISSTGGNVDVGAIGAGDTLTDVSVTKISVVSTKGSADIGAIDFSGVNTTVTGNIAEILASGTGGADASATTSIGTIAADTIGTVTAVSSKSDAVIGAITVGANTGTNYTDGTITAIVATGALAATVGNVAADSIGSITISSTDTTTGGAAQIGTIKDGSGTGKATLGTLTVTSAKSSVQTGAITAAQTGALTVTGATTAQLGAVTVTNTAGDSTTGAITVSAGTGNTTIGAIDVEKAGDFSFKSTAGNVIVGNITLDDADGQTITIAAGAAITHGATGVTLNNTKGDLGVTLTGTTLNDTAAFTVKAGTTSAADIDINVDASGMTGQVGVDGTNRVVVDQDATDAASSVVAKGGAAANFFTLASDGGTVTYYGKNAVDTVTVSGTYATSSLYTEGGADVVVTGDGIDTIILGAGGDTVTSGKGADTIYLGLSDAAIDTVVMTTGGAIAVDSVHQFEAGTGKDIVKIDLSDINGLVTDLMLIGDATDQAAAAAPVVTALTAALDLGTAATSEILAVSSTTAFTTTTLARAMETGGSLALTANNAWDAGDAFLVLWDDNADTYLSYVTTTAGVADNALAAASDLTVTNILKLVGVTDAATFHVDNFVIVT